MSRSRWTPFLFAFLAGAAAWAAWRFLPRPGLRPGRGPAAARDAGPTGGPRPAAPVEAVEPRVAQPEAAEAVEPPAEPAASPEPARCTASTQSGDRCRREAEPGSPYCWQHATT